MLKKILFISLCSVSLIAGEIMYSTIVKPVYIQASDSKVAAKLLPTNAVEILSEENDKIKFSIKGYQNPSNKNIIYYSDGQRIISLAFSKTSNPKIKIEKEGKNGAWNQVSTVAYTTKGDFVKDVASLFDEASKIYNENCSICHSVHSTTQYTANQWPALFKGMSDRTPIEKEKIWTIVQYLQKNASDMKK